MTIYYNDVGVAFNDDYDDHDDDVVVDDADGVAFLDGDDDVVSDDGDVLVDDDGDE